MINDFASVFACATGALASLKGKKPEYITVDKSNRLSVTYSESDGVVYCLCNGFRSYAKIAEKDFAIFIDENPYNFVAENPDLLKMLLTSAAKVMSGIPGAELYISQIE